MAVVETNLEVIFLLLSKAASLKGLTRSPVQRTLHGIQWTHSLPFGGPEQKLTNVQWNAGACVAFCTRRVLTEQQHEPTCF